MRTVSPRNHYLGCAAKVTTPDHHVATPTCSFVLSRCLGSSSYYSLWLLEGTNLLEHWIVLADGSQGLRQPTIFLLQSVGGIMPAAHHDEGPCRLVVPHVNGLPETTNHTVRQALTKGCLTLQLEGKYLQGSYLLQRVGAGRGHTWQLMLLSKE
ncbi:hypothetical protein [Hymenobacter cavernae]|uniref:Uncharacterized protein n=1 Tax=Hymenobacter cavernae TaxID=2044852 RepID=A0ABQ1TQV7_9BACT|nr:hypothetical protein [Hymenobacter cavernae]GGE99646.1 hypothetical protein GCM10011383_08120 [Hymenobacter cavernae]